MNIKLINTLKKVFGLKVVEPTNESTDTAKTKNVNKSDLNEITLKMDVVPDISVLPEIQKPKKKRYYKKKTNSGAKQTVENKTTTVKNNGVDKKPANKKRRKPNKPKTQNSVYPESKSDI